MTDYLIENLFGHDIYVILNDHDVDMLINKFNVPPEKINNVFDLLDIDPERKFSVYDVISEDKEKNLKFFKLLQEKYNINLTNLDKYFDKECFDGMEPFVYEYGESVLDTDISTDKIFKLERIDNFNVYNINDDYMIASTYDLFDDSLYEEQVEKIIKDDLENNIDLFDIDILDNLLDTCEMDVEETDVLNDVENNLLDMEYSPDSEYDNELIKYAIDHGFVDKDDMPDYNDYENDDEYNEAYNEWLEETMDYIKTNINELALKYFNEIYGGSILEYFKERFSFDEAAKIMIDNGYVKYYCLVEAILQTIRTNEGFAEFYFNHEFAIAPKEVTSVDIDGFEYYLYIVNDLV